MSYTPEWRLEQVGGGRVEPEDHRQHDEKEAGRARRGNRERAEADVDLRHADETVRGAEFARVVDDLRQHLGHAKGDEREIDAAHPVGDQPADDRCRERCDERRAHGRPERGHAHEHERRHIGADAEIHGLPERQRARIAEQEIDRQGEAGEDQCLRGEPEIEGVAHRGAERRQGERGENEDRGQHMAGAHRQGEAVMHGRGVRTALAGGTSGRAPSRRTRSGRSRRAR